MAPLFDAYRVFYGQQSDLVGATDFLAERLRLGESVIFLAESAPGEAAGFTQLYPAFTSVGIRRLWLLNDLYVSPHARRLGVGTALLEAARRHGQETGSAWLELTTDTGNVQAQATYEAHGWKRDERFFTYVLKL